MRAGRAPQPDGSVNVDGSVPVRDLNRAMDWSLPDEEATTIAGLVIHEAQTIPDTGQVFTFHNFRFQVLRKSRNRITAPEDHAADPCRGRRTAEIARDGSQAAYDAHGQEVHQCLVDFSGSSRWTQWFGGLEPDRSARIAEGEARLGEPLFEKAVLLAPDHEGRQLDARVARSWADGAGPGTS